ncbi:Na+/H+ antiporter NhaA [Flavobacteriaceae bacterium M23B6Z8]
MKRTPSDRFVNIINQIFGNQSAQGITLFAMVLVAMIWVNSPWEHSYHWLWNQKLTIGFENFAITETLHHWINDGLMAYFFFMVGLEVKREFMNGELATFRKAALPITAALGGMLVPAAIYFLITYNGEGSNGWGIPMATDIAFAIGLISLLGSKVSASLKTFLTALATADDIGAILVIAFFLTNDIQLISLAIGGVYFIIMLAGNMLGVRSMWFYLFFGIFGLWVAILLSGIHATLAGVLAALTIPARTKLSEKAYLEKIAERQQEFNDTRFTEDQLLTHKQVVIIQNAISDSKKALTPLQRVEENIKPFVYYFILPIFALSNAGVVITSDYFNIVTHPISLGIILGLLFGKLIGIVVFSKMAVSFKLGVLPYGVKWKSIAGVGFMAGIGFTMSLFIAGLALKDENLLQIAKTGILTGSLLSAIIGLLWLNRIAKKDKMVSNEE